MTLDVDVNSALLLLLAGLAFWRFPSKTRMRLEMREEIDRRGFPSSEYLDGILQTMARQFAEHQRGLERTLGHNIDRHSDRLQGIDYDRGRSEQARETLERRVEQLEMLVIRGWQNPRPQA